MSEANIMVCSGQIARPPDSSPRHRRRQYRVGGRGFRKRPWCLEARLLNRPAVPSPAHLKTLSLVRYTARVWTRENNVRKICWAAAAVLALAAGGAFSAGIAAQDAGGLDV